MSRRRISDTCVGRQASNTSRIWTLVASPGSAYSTVPSSPLAGTTRVDRTSIVHVPNRVAGP
jgi:hypothetical protein